MTTPEVKNIKIFVSARSDEHRGIAASTCYIMCSHVSVRTLHVFVCVVTEIQRAAHVILDSRIQETFIPLQASLNTRA